MIHDTYSIYLFKRLKGKISKILKYHIHISSFFSVHKLRNFVHYILHFMRKVFIPKILWKNLYCPHCGISSYRTLKMLIHPYIDIFLTDHSLKGFLLFVLLLSNCLYNFWPAVRNFLNVSIFLFICVEILSPV